MGPNFWHNFGLFLFFWILGKIFILKKNFPTFFGGEASKFQKKKGGGEPKRLVNSNLEEIKTILSLFLCIRVMRSDLDKSKTSLRKYCSTFSLALRCTGGLSGVKKWGGRHISTVEARGLFLLRFSYLGLVRKGGFFSDLGGLFSIRTKRVS